MKILSKKSTPSCTFSILYLNSTVLVFVYWRSIELVKVSFLSTNLAIYLLYYSFVNSYIVGAKMFGNGTVFSRDLHLIFVFNNFNALLRLILQIRRLGDLVETMAFLSVPATMTS